MTNQSDFNTFSHADVVLQGRVSAPEHYADGISQIMILGSVAKIMLHTVVLAKMPDNPEVRRAVQTLTMPSLGAIEMAHLVLRAAKDSEERLLSAMNEKDAARVKDILSQIQVELPPEILRTSDDKPKKTKTK